MRLAAVLKCEDVAGEQTDHQTSTHEIQLQNLLFQASFHRLRALGCLEEEERDNCCNTTNGQVDPEAPSPRQSLSEGSSEEWSKNCGDGISRTDHAQELRTLRGRSGETDDGEQTDRNAGAANTSDRSANNEGSRVLSDSADDATDLENEDCDHVPDLDGHVFVELSPCRLEATEGHEVGGAVP